MFVKLDRCVIENNTTNNSDVNHQKSILGFIENSINSAISLKVTNDDCLRKKAIVKIVRIEDEINNEYNMKRNNLDFSPNMTLKNTNGSIKKSTIISNPSVGTLSSPFIKSTSLKKPTIKTRRKWRPKKIFCMYCKKMLMNFARHLARLHKDQEKVKEYLKLPKHHPKRRILIGQIARRGNYLYSIYTKSNTEALITDEQQPMNFLKKTSQDYLHRKTGKIKKYSLNLRKKNFQSIKNVNQKNNNKQSFIKLINDNVDDDKIENICIEDSMNDEDNLEIIDDDTESIESDFEMVLADPCTISEDPTVIPNLVDTISPDNSPKKPLKKNSSNANRKKKKPKHNSCFFCKKLVIKMSRHLLANHRNEERVKEITKLPKYDLFRRRLMCKLCKDGNILRDEESRINTRSSTKTQQQEKMAHKTAEDFITCPFCQNYFAKVAIIRHYKLCSIKHVHEVANDVLRKYIIPKINSNSAVQLIKYDELILIMGNKWTEIYDYDRACFNLKLMGSFKEALLRYVKDLDQLSSVLQPNLYDTVLEAIYECSNEKKTSAKAANTAFIINSILKATAEQWISECIKRNNEVEKNNAEKFIELCNNYSSTFMNFKVLKKKVNNIREKKRILALNSEKDNFQVGNENQSLNCSALKDKDACELTNSLQTISNEKNNFTSDDLALNNEDNKDKLENDHNGDNNDNSNKDNDSKTVIRKKWTETEREAVIKYFGDLKKLEKLPTLKRCETAIHGDPAIGHRTPAQLKKWIHYQRTLKSN